MKKIIINIISYFSNLLDNYSWQEIEKDPSLLEKKSKKFFILKQICPQLKFEWFWNKSINELRERDFFDFDQLFNSVHDNEKFILSKLLYFCDGYNDKRNKSILRFALETRNPKYRYWITQDVSRFTFRLQKGIYENYYNDRRQLLKQICCDLNLNKPQKKEQISNKLCIVTHLLDGSIKNSAQRVATMIVNGVIGDFSEIIIFPLDIFSPTKIEKKELTTVLPFPSSFNSKEKIKMLFPENVKICFPQGKNYREKFQYILSRIYEFNPYVIFDMSDEYSVISYLYSQDFYTVYFPLRDTNSSMFFSAIVGAPKWKYMESNQNFNSIDINLVKEWNFPEYVPPKTNHHNRKNMIIPEDSFVMITIGNNSTTFTIDFINEMCGLVEKKKYIWLLVGEDAPEYMKKNYSDLYNQRLIIEVGYEEELYSLCSICDVHVRPNMTGGSGATAIAAMAGLPIAMTNYLCDPSRWLGNGFHSEILTYKDLVQYIIKLSENDEFYNSEKNKVVSLVNNALDTPQKWKVLANILKRR